LRGSAAVSDLRDFTIGLPPKVNRPGWEAKEPDYYFSCNDCR
jgi:hypothetical protein